MNEHTKKKIIAALKRAGHTMAQTAIATIGTAAVIESVNWHIVISASLLAGLLSLLKSIALGMPEVIESEDSFIPEALDELTDNKEEF